VVYDKEDESLYFATLGNGSELLLSPTDVDDATGDVIWVSLDIKNLELASLIGKKSKVMTGANELALNEKRRA